MWLIIGRFEVGGSNRLIFFFFSFSHHIGKSLFLISTYMEEVLQQIDFPPFYMEREM